MNNAEQVIKEISVTNTAGDLWENAYAAAQGDKKILSFYDGCSYKLRFLGPIIRGRRLYVPPEACLHSKVSQKEIIGIIKGDESLYTTVKERVFEDAKKFTTSKAPQSKAKKNKYGLGPGVLLPNNINDSTVFPNPNPKTPKEKEFFEALKAINYLFKADTWQSVLFSNVYVKESNKSFSGVGGDNIYIICLNEAMVAEMFKAATKDSNQALNKKISGILAYDFVFSRQGNLTKAKYIVNISEQQLPLTETEINNVFRHGLLDIKSIVFQYNKTFSKERKSFVYRVNDEYRLSNQFMQELCDEESGLKHQEYVYQVDENINYLPKESLENDYGDTITSLEL